MTQAEQNRLADVSLDSIVPFGGGDRVLARGAAGERRAGVRRQGAPPPARRARLRRSACTRSTSPACSRSRPGSPSGGRARRRGTASPPERCSRSGSPSSARSTRSSRRVELPRRLPPRLLLGRLLALRRRRDAAPTVPGRFWSDTAIVLGALVAVQAVRDPRVLATAGNPLWARTAGTCAIVIVRSTASSRCSRPGARPRRSRRTGATSPTRRSGLGKPLPRGDDRRPAHLPRRAARRRSRRARRSRAGSRRCAPSIAHQVLLGARAENPAAEIESPRRRPKLPRTLSPREAERLIEAAAGTTPRALRDAALVELLYGAGPARQRGGRARAGRRRPRRAARPRASARGTRSGSSRSGARRPRRSGATSSRGRPYLDRRHRARALPQCEGRRR